MSMHEADDMRLLSIPGVSCGGLRAFPFPIITCRKAEYVRPAAAVQAASAAGMRVVTVPSLPKSEYPNPDLDASSGGPPTAPPPPLTLGRLGAHRVHACTGYSGHLALLNAGGCQWGMHQAFLATSTERAYWEFQASPEVLNWRSFGQRHAVMNCSPVRSEQSSGSLNQTCRRRSALRAHRKLPGAALPAGLPSGGVWAAALHGCGGGHHPLRPRLAHRRHRDPRLRSRLQSALNSLRNLNSARLPVHQCLFTAFQPSGALQESAC